MLRCAVIGLGNAGKKHLKVYQDHPECEVVQASDNFNWNVPMDLVSICTPDDWHSRHLACAMGSGAHAFCEKPFVLEMDDEPLRMIFDAFESRGLRLSMNMVMRARVPKTTGAYRIDAAYNWGRKEKLSGWRGDFDYHPILGGGIHLIDLMVRDLGNPLEVKSLHQGLTSTTLLRFERGLGTLVSDLNSPPPHYHQYDVWREDKPVCYFDPLADQLDDRLVQTSFIDSILHGTPAMVTEEDVFNTMKVCFDAVL